MKPLRDCRLYTFFDVACLTESDPEEFDPEEVARQLCDGGADLVQLRAKGWETDFIRCMAELLLPITDKAGVWLVINDHPEIARDIGAPMVHLGQEDFFDAGYREATEVTSGKNVELPLLPQREEWEKRLRLGLSSHSPEQAKRALRAGPDYIAIGPVFATPTKPGRPAATLDYVRWAAANVSIPWFAIGGITLENLDDVLAAGATRVCVVRAILNAPDIAKACRAFKDRLRSAP